MCAQQIASHDLSPARSAPKDVSPTQKLTIASSEPNFRFTPPAGGDLTIVSKDGVEFLVHSDALGRSSSVFADMFSIGTKGECAIQLADDAESISLMLGFIYSTDPFSIQDPSILEKVLQLAQKYDIEAIMRTLDETSPNTDLISADPFRVFQIGLTYGLPNTSMLAAKTTQRQYRYFQDLKAINGFTSRFPGTASLVNLIGVAGARVKVLHDVLYDFQSGNPSPDSNVEFDPEMFAGLLCTTCFRHLRDWRRFPDPAFRPHWFFDWARLAFNELSAKDIDECDDLFNASVFGRIAPGCDYPSCIGEVSNHGPLFNTWAENVKLKLHSELSKLESLYS